MKLTLQPDMYQTMQNKKSSAIGQRSQRGKANASSDGLRSFLDSDHGRRKISLQTGDTNHFSRNQLGVHVAQGSNSRSNSSLMDRTNISSLKARFHQNLHSARISSARHGTFSGADTRRSYVKKELETEPS